MYSFHMPTKITVGTNAVKENTADLILGTRAMIVTGKSSGKKSGALDDVTDALTQNNIPYLIYDKIENNPTIESTAEGGAAARGFGADFLIGIGGGSPLDAAKAIAVYAVNEPKDGSDFELYDIFNGSYKNKPLPMAGIPTTAGTGSEATPYSILTLHRDKNKKSFSSPDVFYKTAFIDG
ncbi:MAG: iron-containing alcohol dehydrogenase, partial [Candidatus Ornithomonoglobus sp.]